MSNDASIGSYNETRDAGIRLLRSGMRAHALGEQEYLRAFLVDGPPGVGKTIMRHEIAQALGLKHQFIIKLSHHEVPDVAGVPVPLHETQRTHFYASADMLPADGLKGGCLVTIDETGDQNISQQNLTCQFVFEGRIHNYTFPDNTYFFLTSNRVQDRSGSNRIITKLGNRIAWRTMHPLVEELFVHGSTHGWNPVLLAFLKMHGQEKINPDDKRMDAPTYFHSFDPADSAQMAKPQFASPRSYEFTSDYLNYMDESEPSAPDSTVVGDVASLMGTPVATRLVAFRKIANTMPDPDEILKGTRITYPTKQEVLWSLALTLTSKVKKENVKHLYAFLDRGPDEYLALAARILFDTRVSELAGKDFHEMLRSPKLKAMFNTGDGK